MDIVHVPGINLYAVQFQGGGKIPDDLSGKYTTMSIAQKAIDNYLLHRRSK